MPNVYENVKSISTCKEQINNLAGLAVSKYFYSNNGPPPEPVPDTLRLLLAESDGLYKPLLSSVIESIENNTPIAETCPVAEVVRLAEVAEKHNMPGYQWERLTVETVRSIAQIWLARGMVDKNPQVISQAYAILNGDLTHLTDLTDLTGLTTFNKISHGFNANLTLFNAASELASSDKKRFQGNLLGEIRRYVAENEGSFTTAELDRWLGITHPADKNIRRQACFLLLKNKEIRKDKRIIGKYFIVKKEINLINIIQTEITPFNINLPLGLDKLVRVPKKSIIIIAGTFNAGKTTLALEILKANIYQPYPLYYLMSEMGPSEYKSRVLATHNDLHEWNNRVCAADMTTGFEGAIMHHNPDGLTVIDYLEEIDGEYYRISSDIRGIYDALKTGVAIVSLQKHTRAEVGRGGEATAEKARLYLTMDVLIQKPRCVITAIKIIKAKDYLLENPNGKEIHVEIRAGTQIKVISDWMYCNQKQREQYIKRYQHMEDKGYPEMPDGENELAYRVVLEDGSMGNILKKDVDRWQENMPDINVPGYLAWLERKTKDDEIRLTKKSWFPTIASMLAKKQNQKDQEKNEPWQQT